MCNRDFLRSTAEVYFENDYCVYASTRDPRDPAEVLPGSGIAIPIAHRASPFDFMPEEWLALQDVLTKAKAAWDERLAPDGYFLSWTCFPSSEDVVIDMHAHLHVVPRFDDEPYSDRGGRTAIKEAANRRPDPFAPGTGRAKLFGPSPTVSDS
jgi:diadenosine tetraphosphate (Ap4A) HIT family hydrolase